jgi:hypothetical protein
LKNLLAGHKIDRSAALDETATAVRSTLMDMDMVVLDFDAHWLMVPGFGSMWVDASQEDDGLTHTAM